MPEPLLQEVAMQLPPLPEGWVWHKSAACSPRTGAYCYASLTGLFSHGHVPSEVEIAVRDAVINHAVFVLRWALPASTTPEQLTDRVWPLVAPTMEQG